MELGSVGTGHLGTSLADAPREFTSRTVRHQLRCEAAEFWPSSTKIIRRRSRRPATPARYWTSWRQRGDGLVVPALRSAEDDFSAADYDEVRLFGPVRYRGGGRHDKEAESTMSDTAAATVGGMRPLQKVRGDCPPRRRRPRRQCRAEQYQNSLKSCGGRCRLAYFKGAAGSRHFSYTCRLGCESSVGTVTRFAVDACTGAGEAF